jgi:hypothetical protein
MTATVKRIDADRNDDAPPRGTAIVRPLRHVRAVREHHARNYDSPAEAAASRSAHAWAWALGESTIAPVTGRHTAVPPSRDDIDAEIAAATEQHRCGDRENPVGEAAIILRWLVGDDDGVPVLADNPGELVGGWGDIVRSPSQIASILALVAEGQRRAAAESRDISTAPEDRRFAQQDADYLRGVAATLAWILGDRPTAPITAARPREITTRDLKTERVHAEDVIEQARYPWMADRLPPHWYGQGVKLTIAWLLGDSTAPPIDPTGCGPYGRDSNFGAWPRTRSFNS